jgi:hypothetical protein
MVRRRTRKFAPNHGVPVMYRWLYAAGIDSASIRLANQDHDHARRGIDLLAAKTPIQASTKSDGTKCIVINEGQQAAFMTRQRGERNGISVLPGRLVG